MSYILDALKRSEQERHQEQVANLSSDMMLLASKQRKTHIWPYLLITVLTLNVGVYSYFNWVQHPSAAQKNELQDEPVAINLAIKERPIPAHLAQKPVLRKIPSNPVKQDETKDVYVDGGLLIEPKVKKQAAPVMPEPHPVDLTPENNAAPPQVTVDPFEYIMPLSNLSLKFRRGIPALSFNSHIYSDNPKSRRVMINSLYLREGDEFSGMKLLEIGEFYIVLKKGQQQFKLPVLRDWQTP